eukprot:gene1018-1291_t
MNAKLSKSLNSNSCSYTEYGNDSNDQDYQYIKLQVDNYSLLGKFINYGEIDGKPRSIENQMLDSSSKSTETFESQAFLGIKLPNFKNKVTLDPDFSLIVDYVDAKDKDGSNCTSKGGLTKPKLAGIIVGSIAGAAVIITAVSYTVYKRRQHNQFQKSMSTKLNSIN